MNIKHGDIITLENGDTVKVSLEIIKSKVTELIPSKKYKLKESGNFCHAYTQNRSINQSKNLSTYDKEFIFLNFINTRWGKRAIFVSYFESDYIYAMYSVDNLDFVVNEI